MSKRVLMLLLTSLVIAVSLSGVVRPSAAAPPQEVNVIIVSCLIDTVDMPAFRAIRVVGASSSANAPEVPSGGRTNCAQTLAALLSVGFDLISVDGSTHGALYTLYRKN